MGVLCRAQSKRQGSADNAGERKETAESNKVADAFVNQHLPKKKPTILLEEKAAAARSLNAVKIINAINKRRDAQVAKFEALKKKDSSKACKEAHSKAFNKCMNIVAETNTKCISVLSKADKSFAQRVLSGISKPATATSQQKGPKQKGSRKVSAKSSAKMGGKGKGQMKPPKIKQEEAQILSGDAAPVGQKPPTNQVVADTTKEEDSMQDTAHLLRKTDQLTKTNLSPNKDDKFVKATKKAKKATSSAIKEVVAMKKTAADAVAASKKTTRVMPESQKSLYEQQEELFEELVQPM